MKPEFGSVRARCDANSEISFLPAFPVVLDISACIIFVFLPVLELLDGFQKCRLRWGGRTTLELPRESGGRGHAPEVAFANYS